MVLVFSDGFSDNVFDSGMPHCIEEYLHQGMVTSLSKAADCLARKAYFLSKNPEYQSVWKKEYKYAADNNLELPKGVPTNYTFIGGKQDDITVTVAQVFKDRGADDRRRSLSARDTYFKN